MPEMPVMKLLPGLRIKSPPNGARCFKIADGA
jgi:hypothetical protein